jgi:hypothetical protein
MTLVQKDLTYFFSSSTALGAQNKDNNGARFQIQLDRPITVPVNAVDVNIEVTSANIWFTSPNIDAIYQNNLLYLEYDDGVNSGSIVLTIPKGLYSVNSLNQTVEHLLNDVLIPGSAGYFPCDSILFTSDPATQKIKLQFGNLYLSMLTDQALLNNIAPTLGFYLPPVNGIPITDIGSIGPSLYTGQVFTAPSVAQLNKINAYLIHGDIVKNGIAVNNTQANILTEVQLTVSTGKLLTYRPYLPYKLDGTHLKYGSRDFLTFWLTDELNRYIDTNGEDFSFALTISYKVDMNHNMTHASVPSVHSSSR